MIDEKIEYSPQKLIFFGGSREATQVNHGLKTFVANRHSVPSRFGTFRTSMFILGSLINSKPRE